MLHLITGGALASFDTINVTTNATFGSHVGIRNLSVSGSATFSNTAYFANNVTVTGTTTLQSALAIS